MKIIDKIKNREPLTDEELTALADSHERLYNAAKKVNSTMRDAPLFRNFKLTLETALEQADKLSEE